MDSFKSDILVIGAGIAGCVAALKAADNGLQVNLIMKGKDFRESNTYHAQGGIVYKGKADNPSLLTKDILEAGNGVSNPLAVKVLAKEGPRLLKEILLDRANVPFDRCNGEMLDLTTEAAHSDKRIIHVADATGRAIEESLMKLVKENKLISVYPERVAVDLLTEQHHTDDPLSVYRKPTCLGAYVFDVKKAKVDIFLSKATVLASGGLGRIYLYTTNPQGATGDGFAMASRAGAELINMEYIQFHPTTFCYREAECFLISEALRGEGATLKTPTGESFIEKYHQLGALAPRDVVARAIYEEMFEGKYPYVMLDISSNMKAEKIRTRFPTIYETCMKYGVDITSQPIPVVPAAHFACGGVKVDLWGRTNIDRLLAVGEVSCTGVHGANRLASTSMLEGLVWADRSIRGIVERRRYYLDYTPPPVREWIYTGTEEPDPALIRQDMNVLRHTMWNYVGLIRTKDRLERAVGDLRHLQDDLESFYRYSKLTIDLIELRNAIQTGLIVAQSAWKNRKSRGCHYRRS
ncbi:MAG: L-aspartate oxidase [Nitrososphaeria archaeon]